MIIIQGSVLSRLDYYNSLLVGTAHYIMSRLQQIVNMACGVACNLHKYNHLIPTLKALHWLNIDEKYYIR